jgi:hypothetical protein
MVILNAVRDLYRDGRNGYGLTRIMRTCPDSLRDLHAGATATSPVEQTNGPRTLRPVVPTAVSNNGSQSNRTDRMDRMTQDCRMTAR